MNPTVARKCWACARVPITSLSSGVTAYSPSLTVWKRLQRRNFVHRCGPQSTFLFVLVSLFHLPWAHTFYSNTYSSPWPGPPSTPFPTPLPTPHPLPLPHPTPNTHPLFFPSLSNSDKPRPQCDLCLRILYSHPSYYALDLLFPWYLLIFSMYYNFLQTSLQFNQALKFYINM